MPESVIQRSFAAGELAPALQSRADTAKFQQALRTCRNFFVRREGGVSNRAGTRFTDACKDDTAGKRLMRYVTATAGQSVLIEIGQAYFRFYQDGAPVTVTGVPAWSAVTQYEPGDLVAQGGVNYYAFAASLNQAPPNGAFWYPLTGNIYEIPTPYPSADRFQWQQSSNVITLTHHNHPPRELIFEGLTRWILQTVVTSPSIVPPGGGAGVAGAPGARTYNYVVTSAKLETYEESIASNVITIAACAEPTAAAPNALSWSVVPEAVEYYVYCDPFLNGVFGFIGTAAQASFNDSGFVPDFNLTPPVSRILFQTSPDFPATSANFQQRRFFSNTPREPDANFGSRVGFTSNFSIASPLQDDDAITFRLAGNNQHPVRFLVALKTGLILMTDGGEWNVTGGGGTKSPITPNSIDTEQETYVGIDPGVRPVVIGNTILYVQVRGNVVRDLRFNMEVEGLGGRDVTVYAAHLFTRRTVVAMDYQQTPDSIIWCVRNDGTLLGLTYIPEQEIWGWHRHDTGTNLPGATTGVQSLIEDVCVVPEADEDATYLIVARVIGGATKRFIEKIERRDARDGFFNADTFFVDSGLSYSGPAVNSISGLDHLNGQVVAVLADGQVIFNGDPTAANAGDFTVTAGAIDLPVNASNIHAGLPIRYGEIETLDLDASGTNVRDSRKKVGAVTLLIERSSRGFYAGPDSASLRQYLPNAWDSTALADTGAFELAITSEYNKNGRVFIRQTDPLPLAIIGVIPNVELGG